MDVKFFYGMYWGTALQKAISSHENTEHIGYIAHRFEKRVFESCIKKITEYEKAREDKRVEMVKNSGLIHEEINLGDIGNVPLGMLSSPFTKIIACGGGDDACKDIKYRGGVKLDIASATNAVVAILSTELLVFTSESRILGYKLFSLIGAITGALRELDLNGDVEGTQIEIDVPVFKAEEFMSVEGNNATMRLIDFLVGMGKKGEKE